MTFQSASALNFSFCSSNSVFNDAYSSIHKSTEISTREKKAERRVQVLNCNFEANPNSKSPGAPAAAY